MKLESKAMAAVGGLPFPLPWRLSACATVTGGPPTGGGEDMSEEETAALKAIGDKVKGKIVWSSSRLGNHDLFTSKTDGSDVKQLTKGDAVDWFPRFSPDGGTILFARSKKGWVSERDANADGKWDIFTMPTDGGERREGGRQRQLGHLGRSARPSCSCAARSCSSKKLAEPTRPR